MYFLIEVTFSSEVVDESQTMSRMERLLFSQTDLAMKKVFIEASAKSMFFVKLSFLRIFLGLEDLQNEKEFRFVLNRNISFKMLYSWR